MRPTSRFTLVAQVVARAPLRRALLSLILVGVAGLARADEPYARSREYDLQHSKIALRFDLDQRKVIGDVTHSLSILRDATANLAFDSVGLSIQSVLVNAKSAKFETTAGKLFVHLPAAALAGDKVDVEIRYEGTPKKGLYFILPNKDYPDRPIEIWTQGESEDTRYYLPTYDYPNDRLTTEMILTVPASWITVSNGKLLSVTDAARGQRVWHWKESLPSSTYLITLVAGEFDEVKDTWRGKPVTYYAPRGKGDRLSINFGRTPAMLEFFSRKLGVEYPWEKYAQAMVDDFLADGMENSSATTNTSSSLVHPKLAPEFNTGQDDLISHELGHQWFGDLVTCKDWGDIWLNEGFATYMDALWTEAHFGEDQFAYSAWEAAREWFGESRLFPKPIVRHDFTQSEEFDGNAYTKGGWVLYMLRRQLGDDAFYRGLQHYLEANRGKNVVTADFAKAMEQATHVNIDQFLGQWVYGAGAPKFDLSYTYDGAKKEVQLAVKQTQRVEGRVGLFRVPVEVEITTASGKKGYTILVSEESHSFPFPAESAPLLVLFDKGGKVLKTAEFHKDKKEWLYQLKSAADVADRADATLALGKIHDDGDVVARLGDALRNDRFWGVRALSADALGQIGTPAAAALLLEAIEKPEEPWLRVRIVSALGNFKDNSSVATRLESVARDDNSYRARAAALQAISRLKSPNAYSTLTTAVSADSPDGFLRAAALRAFGQLGDEKAIPLLVEWSSPGKAIESRQAAIHSLAGLDKDNHDVTRRLIGYLSESSVAVRLASVSALGRRGDAEAIPTLESMLKNDDLSAAFAPYIVEQIRKLKKAGEKEQPKEKAETRESDAPDQQTVLERLEKLERMVTEMNERLKSIEARLPPVKK